MITGKINLAALTHVEMVKTSSKTKKEVKGIFIPYEVNSIFQGEKGKYLNIIAFPLKETRDYDTHLVKQSLPKDIYEKMSDEEKNAMPIIGNMSIKDSAPAANNNASEGKTFDADGDDDLPF